MAEDAWTQFRSGAVAELKAKGDDAYEMKREKLSRKAQNLEKDARGLLDKAKQEVLSMADVRLL